MTGLSWASILGPLTSGEDLSEEQAHVAMTEIMGGRAEPSQIAAFIVALRAKGETVDEMVGLVRAMYDAAITVDIGLPVVDTAGTGGDGRSTFNISTTAALIAAGAGAKVAKHGNRAVSSQTGSADVLEELGVPIDLPPDRAAAAVREVGFGFFYAPHFHPAMRFAGPVRRELGVPTVFNFLGPLANPARATRQVIGVADERMAERMIGVCQRLERDFALVFHGADGLDELTTTGTSSIFRLKDGEITHAEFTPSDFGVARARLEDLAGGDAAENASIIRAVLGGTTGPRRDIALVNAAAAIVASGLAEGFADGLEMAATSVEEGAARAVLEAALAFGSGGG
jgi:anthranilate phosphoribosyltransferase